ncbi:uncharacterized protein [Henckelia pumila]|uniref:uncharacterized protein n=1 Tax=Henckelia pumila TaxID=405737 RepID=UPI003C6E1AED
MYILDSVGGKFEKLSKLKEVLRQGVGALSYYDVTVWCELEYIPEIEKTAKRFRKEARLRRNQASIPSPSLNAELNSSESERESDPEFETEESETEETMAEPAQRTLRELANPNVTQQPLCEDPHKHLKEFHIVCTAMKPQVITEEQISLRAFPFSLADKAKDWLYYLPFGIITTWNGMKQQFLEKFFPASRAANIRKDICGIRQLQGETLNEYWERFKKLCAIYPQHQISEQLLIQYLYEGFSVFDRNMVDAASGGALVNKTPQEASDLIANMAANAQQFGTREDNAPRHVKEDKHYRYNLVGYVRLLDIRRICVQHYKKIQHNKPMQLAVFLDNHNVDMTHIPIPTIRDGEITRISATRTKEDNKDFHNRITTNNQHLHNSGMLLDEIVKVLASNTQKFQQETRANMQNLGNQITQLATAVSNLEAQNSGKLSSQTVVNPRENASAMMLRSGKKIEIESTSPMKTSEGKDMEKEAKTHPWSKQRLEKSKKTDYENEVLEMFRKVEINIPLIDAIKQIPRYAKFLKDLCTNKRRLRGDEKIERAMLDLGASINVIPYSIYCALNLGPLKETRVVIQLADRSNAYPEGVVEDVLVQVKELIFPADLYIL